MHHMDEHAVPITNSFNLWPEERRRHVYTIGKTGMGKSSLLESMAITDIEQGAGVIFIDPHGTSAPKLLDHVPRNRVDDVVYLTMLDIDNSPAWNVLHNVPRDDRHLVADGVAAACRHTWPEVWGEGRMDYLFYNTVAAVLDLGDGTLYDCLRMYTDFQFRGKVTNRIENDAVRDFWQNEFPENDRLRREWVAPVQNKLGQLFTSPPFLRMLGQVRNKIDIKSLMDGRKILIVNLAKGAMGYRSKLVGSFLLTQIFLAAMRRALEAEATSRAPVPSYVYVDEAGTFPPDVFAEILSEARKGGLYLTIAHQFLSQLSEQVRDAVFGNVGTMVVFRISRRDATIIGAEFPSLGDGATPFPSRFLAEQGAHQVYIKYDGLGTPDFTSGATLPPRQTGKGTAGLVIARSRERYTRPREEVEAMLRRRRGGG